MPIITGITFSNVMMAVHKKITDKEVFLIGSNAGPAPIAGAQCSPYSFVMSWQNDNQAEVVGKYATDKGYKRVIGMAPNYQAGKDFIAGFKRFYKGEIDRRDLHAAEPARLLGRARAGGGEESRRGVRVLSGRPRRQLRAPVQAGGAAGKIPLLSTSTTDGSTLPAQKDDALGVISGTFWGPDFNNPASTRSSSTTSRRSTTASRRSTPRSPTTRRCCSTRRSPRSRATSPTRRRSMAALKAADFKSVRGNFKFNNNNFPIQDMYVFEVAKDAKGRVSLKTIAAPLKDHQDAYHTQCTLK